MEASICYCFVIFVPLHSPEIFAFVYVSQVEEQKLGIPKLPKLTIDCENEKSVPRVGVSTLLCKNNSMYLVAHEKPNKGLFAIYICTHTGDHGRTRSTQCLSYRCIMNAAQQPHNWGLVCTTHAYIWMSPIHARKSYIMLFQAYSQV